VLDDQTIEARVAPHGGLGDAQREDPPQLRREDHVQHGARGRLRALAAARARDRGADVALRHG